MQKWAKAVSSDSSVKSQWRRIGPPIEKADGFSLVPVFDPSTGETHFLSELPLILLSVLDDRACSLELLLNRLGEDDGFDDAAKQRIQTTLVYLEQAELVECVDRSAA